MKALKKEHGYGLIEVIIGLLIFTLVLIPITEILTKHFKLVTESGIKVTALNLAQSILEEYKNDGSIVGDVATTPYNFSVTTSVGNVTTIPYFYSVTTSPGILGKTVAATVHIYVKEKDEQGELMDKYKEMASLTGEIEK